MYGLPPWLVLGVALGAVASLGIAVVFYAGLVLFPTGHTAPAWESESRRHVEIRQYFDTIDEQYVEHHTIEGQEVAFYLPHRDVAVTFDARAYYRIERSPTEAVLVEHELPGGHLGHRLPFETPELDLEEGGDEGVEPARAAFDVLGVPASASRKELKRAYREKAMEVHPDHGGDTDEFRRILDAYSTAKQHASA